MGRGVHRYTKSLDQQIWAGWVLRAARWAPAARAAHGSEVPQKRLAAACCAVGNF